MAEISFFRVSSGNKKDTKLLVLNWVALYRLVIFHVLEEGSVTSVGLQYNQYGTKKSGMQWFAT